MLEIMWERERERRLFGHPPKSFHSICFTNYLRFVSSSSGFFNLRWFFCSGSIRSKFHFLGLSSKYSIIDNSLLEHAWMLWKIIFMTVICCSRLGFACNFSCSSFGILWVFTTSVLLKVRFTKMLFDLHVPFLFIYQLWGFSPFLYSII